MGTGTLLWKKRMKRPDQGSKPQHIRSVQSSIRYTLVKKKKPLMRRRGTEKRVTRKHYRRRTEEVELRSSICRTRLGKILVDL